MPFHLSSYRIIIIIIQAEKIRRCDWLRASVFPRNRGLAGVGKHIACSERGSLLGIKISSPSSECLIECVNIIEQQEGKDGWCNKVTMTTPNTVTFLLSQKWRQDSRKCQERKYKSSLTKQ